MTSRIIQSCLFLAFNVCVLSVGHATASQQTTCVPEPQAAPSWTLTTNGCKVWNDHPRADETVTWSGSCFRGYAEGLGSLDWFINGEFNMRYEGALRYGTRTGPTTVVWSNGNRLKLEEPGDNSRLIKGSLIAPNGNHYDGEFMNGWIFNGYGIDAAGVVQETWAEGSRLDD